MNNKGIVISSYNNELRISIPKWTADYQRRNCNFILTICNYQTRNETIQVGDFVQINGKIVTKLDNELETRLIRWNKQSDTNRDLIEANICFLPLYYSLYPAKAKEKNLLLAYSKELGYLPITRANNYKKHCIYRGKAIYYLTKTDSEKEIETNYHTGWFIFNNALPVDVTYLKRIFEFFTGIVLDSSLADVFIIYCKQLGSKPIYIRKEISDGIIMGDWIKFIYFELDEAEKLDEQRKIYPHQEDEMNYYRGRRIALNPIKIESPLLNTTLINGEHLEIMYDFEVPINPTHRGFYDFPYLGRVSDEHGIIDVKMEERKMRLKIRSRISNYDSIEFLITDASDVVTEMVQSSISNSFLDSILNQPRPTQQKTKRINTSTSSSTKEAFTKENVIKVERPINSISFNGIVVDKDRDHAIVFANDVALEGKEHIVRLNHDYINPLPNLGDWIQIIMVNKRNNRSFRPDYQLWSAKVKEPVYETSLGSNNTIMLRVPLKVKDGALYNKDLGIVNDIKRRLNIPDGYEKRTVIAWCAKLALDDCKFFNSHWEIANTPDAEWNDEIYSPEISKREFITKKGCIGYIGSRYRTELKKDDENGVQNLYVTTNKIKARNSSQEDRLDNINEAPNTSQVQLPHERIIGTTSKGEYQKQNIFPELSDVDNNKHSDNEPGLQQLSLITDCPQPLNSAVNSPLIANVPNFEGQDNEDYEFLGVIASYDVNSNGYYVYTNQLTNEVFFDTPKGTVEQGTWIKFNIGRNSIWSVVRRFKLLSTGPYPVRADNNSIYMLVKANIPVDYRMEQEIKTEYVPMVYGGFF